MCRLPGGADLLLMLYSPKDVNFSLVQDNILGQGLKKFSLFQ